MNDKQRNYLAMARTVRDYLIGTADIWTTITAAEDATQDLQAAILSAEAVVAQQEDPTTGITEDKAELRDAVEEQTVILAGALEAYVAVSGNHAVLDGVDVTPSMLDRLSEQAVVDVADRVLATATANLAALADYGVTQADLDTLTARRTAFEQARTGPAVARSERAGLTSSLPEKIREIRAILNARLDKLMLRFRATHPEFFAGYEAARVVVDLRGPAENPPSNPPEPETPVAA